MVPNGQKVWTDGRNGRTDVGLTPKYIPLTSSMDNKQAKSNSNIDLKKQKTKDLSINSSSKIITIE